MAFDLWKYYEKNKEWLIYVFIAYAVLNIAGLFFNIYRTNIVASRATKTDEILAQNEQVLQILNKTLENSTDVQICNATK